MAALFPTAEEYHDSQDPDLRARFVGRYWTPATWAAVCQRYPTADLSAFKPAGD
jgi:hypothetical protein